MEEQNLFGDLDELRNTLFQEQEYVKEELLRVKNRIEKSEEAKDELEARLDRLSQALNRLPEKEGDGTTPEDEETKEPEPDDMPEEVTEEKTDEEKAGEVFADPPDENTEEDELPF